MIGIIQSCLESILKENERLLMKINSIDVGHFITCLNQAPRLFFFAQGRSGYILRAFCMRLMHLGGSCFFVGETISPPIKKNDVLIVLSGSGETNLTCEVAKMAKAAGAVIYAVLGEDTSSLAKISDRYLLIPGGDKHKKEGHISAQPLGSLFEQSAFLVLETVFLVLYRSRGEQAGALLEHHANLE